MLDSSGPGNVRNVNQPIYSIFNFNERSKVSQVSYTTMDARSYLIAFVQGLPRIVLDLFHAQANPACLRINAQHFYFNRVIRVHQLTWMFYPFRPTHLRHMNQSFHAILELDEGAVIGNAGNASRHSGTDWKPLLYARPWIG